MDQLNRDIVDHPSHGAIRCCFLLFVLLVAWIEPGRRHVSAAFAGYGARDDTVTGDIITDTEQEWARIRAALRQRQERTRSLHCSWTETEVRVKGTPNPFFRGRFLHPGELPPPLDQDFEFTSEYEFYLDGTKTRYDVYSHAPPQPGGQAQHLRRYTSAFDGSFQRHFAHWPRTIRPAHHGSIDRKRGHIDPKLVNLQPLFHAFRMLDGEIAPLPLDQFSLDHRLVPLDGHMCAVLKWNGPGELTTLWLDREQDYAQRKYIVSDSVTGHVRLQRDTTHVQWEDIGWVPQQWKVIRPLSDGRAESTSSVVTSMKFNQPIPHDTFAFAFPNGTLVSAIGANEYYLIRDNGTRRDVLVEEITGLTLEEIIESETGERFRAPRAWRHWPYIVALNLVILLLIALGWRRRIRLRGPR